MLLKVAEAGVGEEDRGTAVRAVVVRTGQDGGVILAVVYKHPRDSGALSAASLSIERGDFGHKP